MAKINKNIRPFLNPEVAAVFDAYPSRTRRNLLLLRELIFDTAAATEGVGEIEETLKWGEASYLPRRARVGSTVRINARKAVPGQYAMYFHCQTKLLDMFRSMYPDLFNFEGNRAIVFDEGDRIPLKELGECVALALSYHLRKKSGRKP